MKAYLIYYKEGGWSTSDGMYAMRPQAVAFAESAQEAAEVLDGKWGSDDKGEFVRIDVGEGAPFSEDTEFYPFADDPNFWVFKRGPLKVLVPYVKNEVILRLKELPLLMKCEAPGCNHLVDFSAAYEEEMLH